MNGTRTIRFVGAALLFGTLAGGTLQAAQSTASVTFSVSVNITSAIGINKTSDLDFGGVVTDPGGPGTVALSTSGSRSSSPNVSFGNGIPVNATFAVTKSGPGNAHFSVTLPTSVTITNGSASMTVDNFVHNALDGPPYSSAPYTLVVGARLNVAANQIPGTYVGTFTVIVDQN
jgi:spore coat protein U-like protein